ncbi:hypothetical protein [Embleya sp. NBC_00896]|uniref:hypothetical protein n=1 Tax=Embleya sp. NBC_00896 TaxID=2975961 RepID=UPI0038635ABF|nr:hypothetical protein OG928_29995 [Embleya sp. NBC_00896]
MSSRAAQAARARAGRAKASAKRAAPHWARSVGAGMAAVGAGALAAVPGLVAAAGGAALGGLGRVLRVGPGARLGLAGLMWGPRAGAWVWRRLIKRARRLRDTARGEGVSTDFTEPTDVGSTTAAPVLAGAHGSRGEAMTKSVFAARAEQVRDTYSRYSPPTMLCVAAEYRGLPDGLRSAAAALGELACATAERFPAHPQVGAAVVATYLHTMQAAEAAEAVDVAFRELHREDLARHETPRNGERMWNIGEHRADGALAFRQSHFAASCEDVRTVYARWAPEKMMQVLAEYEGLPEGLESLAHAIHHLATLSGEAYPVHQDVAEAVAGIGNFLKRAVSSAQEILPIARRLHAVDISHHEAPRPGEDMWDV